MPEQFIKLSLADQKEALLFAAAKTGRPDYLLEKDVWVVWTLSALFNSPFGAHLVFKGGTSLSKGFGGLIDRFSEDVDLTYDIRQLLPELANEEPNPIPPSSSQAKKWKESVEKRLPVWLQESVITSLQPAISEDGIPLTIAYTPDGKDFDKVFLNFARQFDAPAYVAPAVRLEFGARSSGEPAEVQRIVCDAAESLPEVVFPTAEARVMAAEKTFWEKATAAHAYCIQGTFRGEKFARHWHDLVKLHNREYSARAIADPQLARDVAEHKSMFFREPGVDYHAAVNGALRLVPDGHALDELRAEYEQMVAGGLLHASEGEFDAVMAGCSEIELLANTPR